MRYISICTVDNSFEANAIKEDLADEEIACIVTNENFTGLMPHLNGMLGAGIQILVDKDDIEAAKKIIARRNENKSLGCPNCGSTNIQYGLGEQRRLKKILALFISVLVGSPTRHITRTYYCNDCKTEF